MLGALTAVQLARADIRDLRQHGERDLRQHGENRPAPRLAVREGTAAWRHPSPPPQRA
jgi:hypothetical protein